MLILEAVNRVTSRWRVALDEERTGIQSGMTKESANQEPKFPVAESSVAWSEGRFEHAPREPTGRPHFAAHAPHEHTVATMSFAVSSSASLAAGSAFLGKAAPLRVAARQPAGASTRGGPVVTQAFFGMGAQKQPAGTAMVCRDCGYIYRAQDFNDLPKDWKCLPCGSGKNAFRPEKKQDFKTDGSYVRGVRAAKKENQAAFRAGARGRAQGCRTGREGCEGRAKKGGLFGR